MDINKRLLEIWNSDAYNNLPEKIFKRGFVYAENTIAKDILITGINPSFREGAGMESHGFDFSLSMKDSKWDNYWGPVRKILCDEEIGIDLRDKCAYLDILFFREQKQAFLNKEILRTEQGIRFVADQLNLTQHIIEDVIKPRIIVVKNIGSHCFWGKDAENGVFWMGYKFEKVDSLYCGELCKITGLHDTNERIAREIEQTNLLGTFVLFSHHINQYTKREKRLTTTTLNDLLNKYSAIIN